MTWKSSSSRLEVLAAAMLLAGAAGCRDGRGAADAQGPTVSKIVPVTVANLEHRVVERTVDVIGTLRGWEQVTVGSKRTGRVVKVHHDIGDRVKPGDPLVDLDPVDAKLGVQQAESKYLGELVKLGITRRQAEEFVEKYGISEELLIGQVADEAIAKVPAVVQKRVAREKAEQHLTRQRALTLRGAGTPQELEDADTDSRTADANYDDAVQSARTVIANAVASKVSLSQAVQTLLDMTIHAPTPKLIPPSVSRTGVLSYGITKRNVSEGQMIKEGEAIAELVIEDPIRLWSQVPEQYAEDVRARAARPAHYPGPSRRRHRGQGRADQPGGGYRQSNVSGGNRRAQRARSAAARWLCKSLDHRRSRVRGGRGTDGVDSPVRGGYQALHRRERQGTLDQRHPDRNRRARMGRGDEQAAPRIRTGRHHGPNSTRRGNARRDSRARARCRPQVGRNGHSSRDRLGPQRSFHTLAPRSSTRRRPAATRRIFFLSFHNPGISMTLSDVCINRPVFTWVLVAIPVVLGLFSYGELGVDLFPDVDFPVCTVTTVLQGASVEEMETTVTKPIEDIINTVSGIDELRSTTTEGVSVVTVQFLLSKNGDVGMQEVRDKVNTILADLPDGTDPPIVDKFDTSSMPVMTIAVSGRRDFREVTELARKQIKERLETVNGVGSINLVGGRVRAMNVILDIERLAGYSLSVEDVRIGPDPAKPRGPGRAHGSRSPRARAQDAGTAANPERIQ